jgi:translation initiation factor IF-2
MSEGSITIRLSKAAKEFNVGSSTILEFLARKGFKVENNPNAKLTPDMYGLLVKEYQPDKVVKEDARKIEIEFTKHQTLSLDDKKLPSTQEAEAEPGANEFMIKDFGTKSKIEKGEAVETPAVNVKPEPSIPEIAKPEVVPPAPVKPVPVTPQPVQPIPVQPTPVQKEPEQAPILTPEPVQPEKPVEPVKIPAPPKEVVKEIAPEEIKKKPETIEPVIKDEVIEVAPATASNEPSIKVLGRIDLDALNSRTKPARKSKEDKQKQREEAKAGSSPAPYKAPEPAAQDTPAQDSDTKTTPAEPKTDSPAPIPAEEFAGTVEKEEVSSDPYEKTKANFMPTVVEKLNGLKILGKMDLPAPRTESKKPVATSSDDAAKSKKKKRKRIKKTITPVAAEAPKAPVEKARVRVPAKPYGRSEPKPELTDDEIQKQIKETLQRLSGAGKSKASKHRRDKRNIVSQHLQEAQQREEQDRNVLKVTEFVTANDLATLMNIPITEIISTCLSLGLFVSINQRIDAETISLLADEFGYKVEFVSVEVQEAIRESEEEDTPENLTPRSPVVTVMGHVDHGKTSLLDYIRHANVIAGEAGGITQHVGAYEVVLENGKKITFLDTPGHEAFTAMRARGASVTDIVIIVIAADDTVMPQTIEAINHAQAAGAPIVFAINKIDKNNANVEKIKEELAKINILVEDWGGKYQSQEISAKKGINVDLLLEKVLLEAELLDLRANANKAASGAVLESSLDKGRGYVAKLLVQNGTLKAGDFVLAGSTYGKVKAMYNERNVLIKEAGPSAPVLLLGLSGAPQAGDKFNVMADEREAKSIANKRLQLQREQGIRTQKHITLDEIGRRIAIGDFKELNIIVKADVDGSVEALSDSLLKLSTAEVQVNVIHKSVGQITETDVMLASASNAVIIGFQVRPSLSARKLAEHEEIDVRLYSIIYTAINEIKAAIEGMLSPEIEEKILCNIEVRHTFDITKVGTIAGCMVIEGRVTRNTKIRVIRDGIVVFTGGLGSLKRFKDDVREVVSGYECGLNIEKFNDIRVGDIIEGYEQVEVKRKL